MTVIGVTNCLLVDFEFCSQDSVSSVLLPPSVEAPPLWLPNFDPLPRGVSKWSTKPWPLPQRRVKVAHQTLTPPPEEGQGSPPNLDYSPSLFKLLLRESLCGLSPPHQIELMPIAINIAWFLAVLLRSHKCTDLHRALLMPSDVNHGVFT